MSNPDPNQSPSSPDTQLPPIREFNDRATLWLLEDPHNLQQVLVINYPQLAQLLDFDHAVRENRSLIPPDLTKQETDLLFRIPLQSQLEQVVWLYFLLEHQSNPDPTMLLRLLSYMMEIWQILLRQWEDNNTPSEERKLPLIIPFVFYTGSQEWKEPLQFAEMFEVPEGLEGFVPSWETLFLHLGKTPSEVLLGQMSRMGYVLSVLQVEKGECGSSERCWSRHGRVWRD